MVFSLIIELFFCRKLRQENSTQSLNRFSPYLILSNIDNEDQLIKLPMAEEKDPATLTWAEFFVDLFFPQPEVENFNKNLDKNFNSNFNFIKFLMKI